ncbi:MAG: hypothetical protein IIC91_06620 [Chloroflexi bacterium]|nr:hypothetical protein [Chloroflexota bacterium]
MKNKAAADRILKLSFPADWKELANLPPPERSGLGRTDLKKAAKVAEAAYALWYEVITTLNGTAGKRVTAESPISGEQILVTGRDLWDFIALKVGSYYDFAVRILLSEPKARGPALLPGLDLKIADTVLDRLKTHIRDEGIKDPRYSNGGDIASAYTLGLTCIHFASGITGVPLSARTMEVVSQISLRSLVRSRTLTNYRYQKLLADRLIDGLLDIQIEYLESAIELLDEDHRSGVFSAIQLPELSLLAMRAASVVKKYGRKHVEKVFEHQLSLVFQSFGFHVVSTRSGRSTVDLFCVSSDPSEGYSFMVEAKTTKGRYALPKNDARALRDYANDTKSALRPLPPLKFVLVVASEPAKTIPAKITDLSALLGVPARFCTASQIAALREVIPGPLPAAAFRDEILRSGPVLPDDFAARVARSYEAVQGAHVKFAEQLLSVHQGRLGRDVP